ncbi:hypothetical protein KJA13_04130 [Patescibacteria group bacterium]|nr:hypothetical protein [Patescibacteria group bacterium]
MHRKKEIKFRKASRTFLLEKVKEFDCGAKALAELPEIGSLFLAMSYDKKYKKVEKAIKDFFKDIYTVYMARDCMGILLEGICDKIQEADFGIVVLAGLKKYVKKRRACITKMNVPFEYGMLQILNKPVMLISEENLDLDIKTEFSDISNKQYGEKFTLHRQQKRIQRRIGTIFNKFIPELAKDSAKRALECEPIRKLAYSKAKKLEAELKKVYKPMIENDFKDRIK